MPFYVLQRDRPACAECCFICVEFLLLTRPPPVPHLEMSLRADAAPCGGVVVDFESDDIREAHKKKTRSIPGELLKSKTFKPDRVTDFKLLF